MALAIPWHPRQEFAHRAEVAETGKGQSNADECRQQKPTTVELNRERSSNQNQQARRQTHLAFQGLASLHAAHERQTVPYPRIRPALEHGKLASAARKKLGRDARARSGFADKNDWPAWTEIVEARLDLVHRNIDRCRNMPNVELGRRAHIDELRKARRFRA